MEYFQNLNAFIHRTRSQTLELDELCEYILRKKGATIERLNQSQWKWVFFRIIYSSR